MGPGSKGAPPRAVELVRRGVHHGYAVRVGDPDPGEPAELWPRARPVLLRGALFPELHAYKPAVARTVRMFERLRRGGSFEREVRRRLESSRRFRVGGVSVDLGDEREIEKVHADELRAGRALPARKLARDLYAKLSWIGRDPRDSSLRIRFSFGSERLRDWTRDARRARAADRYAEALFPECELISRDASLRATVERLCGCRVRLSERIVYSNAPGGGAAFHHDGEPRQLGVVYGQLAGRTAWLALPKGELARSLRELAPRSFATARSARERIERPTTGIERLLNADPRLTARLVAAGAFYALDPGDVLILPSHGKERVAWHSVFAVGARPSLAHSYGIFRAGRE